MDLAKESDENVNENSTDIILYKGFEDPELTVKLGTIAAQIAHHNFEWRFITLVMFNTVLHIGVESFLQNYNQTVIIKLGKFVPKHRVHVPQFVLFGQETGELTETLRWLVASKYDNTGLYIIVCTSSNTEKCNEIEMFQYLSHSYFVNSLFLKGSKDGKEPMLFTYYPVLPDKCRNSKPIELKVECTNQLCFKNLYPEKLANLHKCQLYVSTIEQPPLMYLHNLTSELSGSDGDIVKLVINILNGTLAITMPETPEWGHYENGNWTGSLGDIFYKRAHASVCSSPLTPEVYGNFQISFTYNSIDIVWAAKLPILKPSWEKLFYPLKIHTRVALFFAFIIIIWVNAFMKTNLWMKIAHALNLGTLRISLFFYSVVIFLGMPLWRMPSRSTLRAIIINWIWFCFILRTAYQAILVGSLKLQLYDDRLENFQDVLQAKYSYGGSLSLRSYYSEDNEIVNDWVQVKLTETFDVIDGLLDGNSNFVIAVNKESIIHYLMKLNGTKRLQILPDKIVNSPTVMFFKKFSPFRAPVSRVLSLLVEGGFIEDIYSKYFDKSNFLFEHKKPEKLEALTLTHISSSFMILFLGWFLSIVYFVVELRCK